MRQKNTEKSSGRRHGNTRAHTWISAQFNTRSLSLGLTVKLLSYRLRSLAPLYANRTISFLGSIFPLWKYPKNNITKGDLCSVEAVLCTNIAEDASASLQGMSPNVKSILLSFPKRDQVPPRVDTLYTQTQTNPHRGAQVVCCNVFTHLHQLLNTMQHCSRGGQHRAGD